MHYRGKSDILCWQKNVLYNRACHFGISIATFKKRMLRLPIYVYHILNCYVTYSQYTLYVLPFVGFVFLFLVKYVKPYLDVEMCTVQTGLTLREVDFQKTNA